MCKLSDDELVSANRLVHEIAAEVATWREWTRSYQEATVRAAAEMLVHPDRRPPLGSVTDIDDIVGLVQSSLVALQDPTHFTPFRDPNGEPLLERFFDFDADAVEWNAQVVRDRLRLYANHNRYLPYITWWSEGILSTEILRATLLDVWMMAASTRQVPQWMWVHMFNEAGFLAECDEIKRPDASVTLWRGSTPNGWRRLSWTADKAMGAWFAWRIPLMGYAAEGALFEAVVQPRHILAITTERGESE